MEQDLRFMKRCLELASLGRYSVAPNPMVGSVIVHQAKIIGEGYHYQAGSAHAEVNAIASVKDPNLLKDSTLYVSLEPCSHHGRTPPCSDLIIEKGIPEVVIATRDYHSLVHGKGIAKLKKAGVKVREGVLEKEAQFLNRKFFTFHQKQRPYITLKWAQSQDAIIDPSRASKQKGVQWISAPSSQVFSHQLRAEHQAILVGRNTVATDDPSLDTRAFAGADPLRLILDPHYKLGSEHMVFRDGHYRRFSLQAQGENDLTLTEDENVIDQIITHCYALGIQSLLVEGGAKTLQSFIDHGSWDEAFVLEAPFALETGLAAPQLNPQNYQSYPLGRDRLKHYRR